MNPFTINTPNKHHVSKEQSINYLVKLRESISNNKSSVNEECYIVHYVSNHNTITISNNQPTKSYGTQQECIDGIIHFVATIFDDKNISVKEATKSLVGIMLNTTDTDTLPIDNLEKYLQTVIDASAEIQDKSIILDDHQVHQNMKDLTGLDNPSSHFLTIRNNRNTQIHNDKTYWNRLSTIKKVLWVILCIVLLVAGIVPGLIAIVALLIYNYVSNNQVHSKNSSDQVVTDTASQR